MIHENEVLMLLIGCIVLLFSLVYYRALSQTPFWNYLFFSYLSFLVAWTFTVAEGFWFPVLLDHLEHAFYTIASLLLFLWIWKSITTSNPKA